MHAFSSEDVMRGTYGRTTRGASAWPTKTSAMVEKLSAPLVVRPYVPRMTSSAGDDQGHHAQVIEDAHEGREEEDGGQHLEGEDEAEGLRVGHEVAEHEFRALAGEGEQLLDAVVGEGEEVIHRCAEHEHGDGDEHRHPDAQRAQAQVRAQT